MVRNRVDSKNFIIFDIGTGNVGGSLVRFGKGNIPEILYTTRSPIKFKEGVKSTRIVSSMLKALNEVGEELSNRVVPRFGNVDEIHCVLSSLWHVSNTKVFHINKRKPVLITESLFMNFIKSQEKSLSLESFDVDNKKHKKIQTIEKNIIQTKLNGYKTSNPYMKKANNIEMSMFISGTPKAISLEIEKVISKIFNIDEIKYHTFSYTAFSALRDIFEEDDDFVFIDISGELTEVIVVKDDIFLESVTFPIGKNTIVEEVSNKLKISLEEATSKISSAYSKNLIEEESKRLMDSIKKSEKNWQEAFKKAVLGSKNLEEFPKKVFFMSDDDFCLVFKKFIKEAKINETEKKISKISKVDLVSDDLVNKYVKYTVGAKVNPFISISSMFIGRLIN